MKIDFGSSFWSQQAGMNQAKVNQEQQIEACCILVKVAYSKMKQSGLLQDMGRDFLSAVTCARACMVSNDIESWKAYKAAGMPDGLIAALMLRSREVFGDMAKKAMENAGKNIQKGKTGV